MISVKLNLAGIIRNIVTVVILQLVVISLIGCGQDEKVQYEYELPDSFNHLPQGQAIGISPMSFIDTLNSGAMGEVYYFGDQIPENPEDLVVVPGMILTNLGDMMQVLDTLKSREPIFMVSLYGSDARKIAQNSVALGYTCYYVVGGGYKLAQLMRQQRLEFLPRPQMKSKRK